MDRMNIPAQARLRGEHDAGRSGMAPRYVTVEGPIGVGKTPLARRLAEHLGYPILLEPAAENPFLDRFYREGRRHALPTQLFFLLNRARQMAELPRDDLLGPTLIADFLLEKDDLFARMTLDDNEYALYRQIYASLDIETPTAYTEFFHYYDRAPLLVVNASEIDFAHNDRHFAALLAQIDRMDGLRQYFNPNPTLL